MNYRDRIDTLLRARDVDPRSAEAFDIARAEWRNYRLTIGGVERGLSDDELKWNAEDSLADIIRKRERN